MSCINHALFQILECQNVTNIQSELTVSSVHTVMAALRAAGNAMEDSGLDEAWSEADIYGPTTTRHILEAKHAKRALEAHVMTTVEALYDLSVEEFCVDHPHLKGPCVEAAQQLDQEMLKEQQNMLTILDFQRVLKMMAEFDNKKGSQSSLFKFVGTYMRMVLAYSYIHLSVPPVVALHEHTGSSVRQGGKLSTRFLTTSGVRQGCVLAPALFCVAMDWILNLDMDANPGIRVGSSSFTDLVYAEKNSDIIFW